MDVYRKKQQWDAASLPDPMISPLRSYRQLMDPRTERWPVFLTFDQRTLAGLVQDELAERGERPEAITIPTVVGNPRPSGRGGCQVRPTRSSIRTPMGRSCTSAQSLRSF